MDPNCNTPATENPIECTACTGEYCDCPCRCDEETLAYRLYGCHCDCECNCQKCNEKRDKFSKFCDEYPSLIRYYDQIEEIQKLPNPDDRLREYYTIVMDNEPQDIASVTEQQLLNQCLEHRFKRIIRSLKEPIPCDCGEDQQPDGTQFPVTWRMGSTILEEGDHFWYPGEGCSFGNNDARPTGDYNEMTHLDLLKPDVFFYAKLSVRDPYWVTDELVRAIY